MRRGKVMSVPIDRGPNLECIFSTKVERDPNSGVNPSSSKEFGLSILTRLAVGAAGAVVAVWAAAASPASAQVLTSDPVSPNQTFSIQAVPPGCSAWTDFVAGHGRGHLNCVGSGRDVRVTVACGDGSIKRSATGYEYAKAECPSGLGAVAVSGAYV
ncbi:hypothetical protein AB0M95_00610 [Sphaerisporangium sp. NPDC051017]|uniref:hypothetical protein n=1 Tax=Sphaerisporangium sp. NPDC051017 TaxID=3154636 RepID=UPI0034180CE4